ncbi:MAG: YbaY family lipoprotein [Anaerolineae bacterium]|nr:YbaY family lipoprotein [Anaerolineae bacterium]
MKKLITILTLLLLFTSMLPTAVLAQTPPECEFEYTVQAGDWLSKIAEKYYGDILAYQTIVDANNAQTDDAFVDIADVNLIEPGWLLCIPSDGEASTAPEQPAPEGLSPEALANTTYKSQFTQDGTAPLVDGEYSEPAAPGSATMTTVTLTDNIAYGQLENADAAVVVLVTDPGGSGTFYDLAVVVNQNGQAVNLDVFSLGDRVQINSVKIEENEILVDMVTHGPDDPMCCPTQQVIKGFNLKVDALMETRTETVDEPSTAPAESDIVGIIWNWQSFMDSSEENDIVVPNPDNYRLQLKPDGQFTFKADCNSGSGSYTLEGSNLTFDPLMATTLAECGPGSLYNDYLRLLGDVRTYVREGDNLFLNLMADAGNMKFGKLQAVTGRIVAPEGSTLPEGSQVEIRVDDVSLADVAATQIGGEMILDATQFPINFEATYNAQAIEERNTYAVQVRISDSEGTLLFINTQAYNVLTQGNPTYDVEVMVEPVN